LKSTSGFKTKGSGIMNIQKNLIEDEENCRKYHKKKNKNVYRTHIVKCKWIRNRT